MSVSPLARRVLEEYHDAGDIDGSRLRRIEAALAPGLPTARDENWKYASLRGVERARFRSRGELDEATVAAARKLLPAPLPGVPRVVFVDGLHAPQLSQAPLPPGVSVVAAGAAVASPAPVVPEPRAVAASAAGGALLPPPSSVSAADLRFALVNHAMALEELLVDVPADSTLAVDAVFVTVAGAAHSASHPVLRARAGSRARLELVERHLGGAEGSFSNARVLLDAASGARVRLTRLQQFAPQAQHVETLELALADGAECAVTAIAWGAAAARSTAIVRHAGRDAALRWHAVSLARGSQVSDAYVRVDHDAPGARTEQVFRGIAGGRGRVAFNGHMVVHPSAPGADSAQSLKCLIDGAQAEADLRPQLEIHTDAVRATHGATVGKLDEAMRFYLLSRGLEPATAAALLKWAFVEDVVARVEPAELRREVERCLADALGDPVVAEVLA